MQSKNVKKLCKTLILRETDKLFNTQKIHTPKSVYFYWHYSADASVDVATA